MYKMSDENKGSQSAVKLYRDLAIRFLGAACKICGKTEDLVIHHKNGNASNDNIENLIVLCKACHKKKHTDLRNAEFNKNEKEQVKNMGKPEAPPCPKGCKNKFGRAFKTHRLYIRHKNGWRAVGWICLRCKTIILS